MGYRAARPVDERLEIDSPRPQQPHGIMASFETIVSKISRALGGSHEQIHGQSETEGQDTALRGDHPWRRNAQIWRSNRVHPWREACPRAGYAPSAHKAARNGFGVFRGDRGRGDLIAGDSARNGEAGQRTQRRRPSGLVPLGRGWRAPRPVIRKAARHERKCHAEYAIGIWRA